MNLGLNNLPWYGQVGAFVAVSLAALGGFYKFHVEGVSADLAVREEQLALVRAEIAKGLATAAKLPQFQAQVASLEARLESLRAVLPEQKDVGDLLRRIETLATQSSLSIKGFKPQPVATKQLHAEWPIGLELDGSYHNLGLFFEKISKVSRIITITELTIKAKDKQEPGSTISASCTATTYVLIEKPQGAAPAPPSGAAVTSGT